MVYCTKQAVENLAARINCDIVFGNPYITVTFPDEEPKNCNGYARAYTYMYNFDRKRRAQQLKGIV